jgi:hypothetical protein
LYIRPRRNWAYGSCCSAALRYHASASG